MELAKELVFQIQELFYLSLRSLGNVVRKPRYLRETIDQMDVIGVGSLTIVILTGFFTGAVFALQTSELLKNLGATGTVGQLVSFSLVRELGPVLTALMLAGRAGSGIASELGSMVVTEQIDAMRGMGLDPTKKLVTPRMLAAVVMLPLLTAVCDWVGMVGGWLVAMYEVHINSLHYWTTIAHSLKYEDIMTGLAKPIVFGFIIAMVSCHVGLRTKGGTQGVGRSTTQAVVVSSILIIAADFFLSKLLMYFIGSSPLS